MQEIRKWSDQYHYVAQPEWGYITTYTPVWSNFVQYGQTNGQTDGRTDIHLNYRIENDSTYLLRIWYTTRNGPNWILLYLSFPKLSISEIFIYIMFGNWDTVLGKNKGCFEKKCNRFKQLKYKYYNLLPLLKKLSKHFTIPR